MYSRFKYIQLRNVLVLVFPWQKYRHFSPGQNARLIAMASVADTIWCYTACVWFRNS